MFKTLDYLLAAARPRFFGFVHGHDELTPKGLSALAELVGDDRPEVVAEYEAKFGRTVGTGEAISFAAARMAFYAAMKALQIGPGDEVILTGFTCSVMPQAVWRTGATPVYADIERATLGTSAEAVAAKISPRTRLIVAQHSFGIPCAIDQISDLARAKGIFLLEDSALSVSSTLQSRAVGEWGDAAIFSTDHSKPINTLTGGILYTRDPGFSEAVGRIRTDAPELGKNHQRRLFRRLVLESRYYHPRKYGWGRLLTKLHGARRKLSEACGSATEYVLLEADSKPRIKSGAYPFPARLPAFLAHLGVNELQQWDARMAQRRTLLSRLLNASERIGLTPLLPKAYSQPERCIVPLRFVFAHPRADEITQKMKGAVDTDWFWFQEPVSFAPLGPASFGYQAGSCPDAEAIGRNIVNWPIIVPPSEADHVVGLFERVMGELQ